MPLYIYKVTKADGVTVTVELVRSICENRAPIEVDGDIYAVDDTPRPGVATRVVERAHAYMKADGFTRGMPKRPGMSGVNYGDRAWPAARAPVINLDA